MKIYVGEYVPPVVIVDLQEPGKNFITAEPDVVPQIHDPTWVGIAADVNDAFALVRGSR